MYPVYLFDDGLPALSPLNDLRPAFDIRTGAMTTLERIDVALKTRVSGLFVPAALEAVSREWHRRPVNPKIEETHGPAILVNGRAPLPDLGVIRRMSAEERLVEQVTGDTIGCVVEGPAVAAAVKSLTDPAKRGTDLTWIHSHSVNGRALLSRPWHFRTVRDATIAHDLAVLVERPAPGGGIPPPPAGVTVIGRHAVRIDPSAKISPTVVLDAEAGPIVIAEHAVVRPGAIIVGPAYIGPGSTVIERTLIKGNTAIGPMCKVAGEVGGTIFQGFANKAHDGHLGDSYVGEWVNLGAGTTNSNLLNTYGEVVAKQCPTGSNERTGETFLGCVLGDHVKTAICTRIMTGAIVHTGTMWASGAAAAGCVPPFSWVTDLSAPPNPWKPFRFDKFMEVARAAMGRRKVEPSAAYIELMRLRAGANV